MAKTFQHGDWHAWETLPRKTVMLSDESQKKLREFVDADSAINWLFLNGHREVARAFNAQWKGGAK